MNKPPNGQRAIDLIEQHEQEIRQGRGKPDAEAARIVREQKRANVRASRGYWRIYREQRRALLDSLAEDKPALRKDNTSGTPGVAWCKSTKRWYAFVYDRTENRMRYVGSSKLKSEAIEMRRAAMDAKHETERKLADITAEDVADAFESLAQGDYTPPELDIAAEPRAPYHPHSST